MIVGLWAEAGCLIRSLHQVLHLIGTTDQWFLADNALKISSFGSDLRYCVLVCQGGDILAEHRPAVVSLLGERIAVYAIAPTGRLLPMLMSPLLAYELAESNLTSAMASVELHDARNRVGSNPERLKTEIRWLLTALVEPLMDLGMLTESRGIRLLKACCSSEADARELVDPATVGIELLRDSLWSAEQCRKLRRRCD